MSAATSCPKCYRQVSLPESDDHSVWVRCPLCAAQYPLQAALEFVPPILQIVPAPELGSAEPVAASVGASEHAVDAFGAGIMLAATDAHDEIASAPAALPAAMPGLDAVHNGHHALGGDALGGDALGEHSVDDFDAALSLDDELKADDDDVPFIDDSEHAQDEAEHDPDADLEDGEFRFADEHSGEPGEFDEAGDSADEMESDSHAMGAIATMAAKPPRVRKKVPMKVKIIGVSIFVMCNVVLFAGAYSAFLFFHLCDPLDLHKSPYCPKWLIAKWTEDSPGPKPNRDVKPQVKPAPTDNAANTPTQPAVDAGTGTPPNPNANGPANPPANNVAAQASGPADPATSPFGDQPKPNDADAGTDQAKLDPLGSATKPPSIELPDLKLGPKPLGDKPAAEKAAGDKSVVDKPPVDQPPFDKPAVDKPAADKPPVEAAVEKPADKPVEKPIEAPAEAMAPKSDATYSAGDLTTAIDAANRSSAALAEADKSGDEAQLKTARIVNYKAMSHLATVLTFVKAPDAKAAEQVDGLKNQIAASLAAPSPDAAPAERDSIGTLAGKWINAPSRKASKEDGLFAAGTLKKTEPRGKLFESVVELPGGAAPITVVTTQKPAIEEGSPVLLLGAIVNEPAKNLAGYEGAAEMVIFGDVLVPPAKTAAAPPGVDPSKKPADDALKPSDAAK